MNMTKERTEPNIAIISLALMYWIWTVDNFLFLKYLIPVENHKNWEIRRLIIINSIPEDLTTNWLNQNILLTDHLIVLRCRK